MNRLVTLTLCLLTLTSTACSNWKEAHTFTWPVFSDDGDAVAGVKLTFQAKDTYTHTKQKGFKVQVLLKENLDGSAPEPITELLPGKATDLFYMRSRGYLVLGRHTNWLGSYAGGAEATVTYEKITLDGTMTTIASGVYPVAISCGPEPGQTSVAPQLRVIPSPDGMLLAKYESEASCSDRVQTLTFLDADSLQVVEGPFDVPAPEPEIVDGAPVWQPVEMGWTESGAFATGFWGHGPDFDHLWTTHFRPGQAPLLDQVTAMGCLHPATTSSGSNADGLMVHFDDQTGATLFQGPTPDPTGALVPAGSPFGCTE